MSDTIAEILREKGWTVVAPDDGDHLGTLVSRLINDGFTVVDVALAPPPKEAISIGLLLKRLLIAPNGVRALATMFSGLSEVEWSALARVMAEVTQAHPDFGTALWEEHAVKHKVPDREAIIGIQRSLISFANAAKNIAEAMGRPK